MTGRAISADHRVTASNGRNGRVGPDTPPEAPISISAYPQDSDMLPPDPILPQLRHAWNAKTMRQVFRDTLGANGGQTVEIEDCVLHRFRYREGRRAIMLYDLHVTEPATGLKRRHWASGVVYRGQKTKRLYNELRTRFSEHEAAGLGLPFPPVSYIDDLKMLVQLFPFDRHLPTLPALMTGPPPELESLLLEQFGPGYWQVERCDVEVVRYRPALGATLRFNVLALESMSGRRQMKCFYIKVYRANEGKRVYESLSRLHEFCEAEHQRFTTPRPIAYLNDLRALVMDSALGRSLEDLMVSPSDVVTAARTVAQALAALHGSNFTIPRCRTRDDTLRRAKRAATFLQWGCPKLRSDIEQIVVAIEARLEKVAPNPAHLDIKPDHIFLDDDRVTFIDLDSYAAADPVLDAATLLARLDAMPSMLPVSHVRVESFTTSFTGEYFARVPSEWPQRLAVDYACAALKVALFFLQHLEPNWPDKIAAIVASARSALAGRAW